MILDPTIHLQMALTASASVSDPEYHIVYIDYTPDAKLAVPLMTRGELNNAVDVTVLSAPVNNQSREIQEISIYNKDSQDNTVTVKTDDGTTERILVQQAISAGRSLTWGKHFGWVTV